MILQIRVVTNARVVSIEELAPDSFKVKLRAKPIEGEANRELIEVLAEHFNVPRSNVRIIRGEHSKNKVVEIAE